MQLRRATEDDRNFVHELCKSSLEEYFNSIPEGWSDDKFHKGYDPERIRIIEDSQGRAGFIDYEIRGDELYCHHLHLEPRARRKGIGTRAMDFLKQMAVGTIYGKVFSDNTPSREFLKANGFSEVEFLPEEDSYIIRWKRNS